MPPIRADLEAFEGLPVALLLVRAARVVYVNPAYERFSRVSREQLVGHDVSALLERYVVPSDRSWVRASLENALRDSKPVEALWLRTVGDDGAERELSIRIAPLSGTPDEWVLIFSEESEEDMVRRLSAALAHSSEQFLRCRDEKAVLDQAMTALRGQKLQIGFLLHDEGGLRFGPFEVDEAAQTRLKSAFPRTLDRMVLQPRDIPVLQRVLDSPRALYAQDFRSAEDLLGSAAELAGCLQSRGPIFGMRLVVAGRVFGLLVAQGHPLSPAAASVLELFGRHVAAALENVRHHEQASRRLEELTRLQAELVARERLAALGGAAALVAHEVRNPLGAILNAATLLKRSPDQEGQRDLLEMIEEEALRIDGLVEDLLELANPLVPTLHPIELKSVVEDAARALGVECDHSEAPIQIDSDCTRTVEADSALVQMAVEHLLRNALKASPPGKKVRVRVGASGQQGGFIRVADEGAGIPERERERIFEPFYTTHVRGRGLGLALVKRVAEAHGGVIEVASGQGGGALLILRLPGAPGY